jgi:hypothetical protein
MIAKAAAGCGEMTGSELVLFSRVVTADDTAIDDNTTAPGSSYMRRDKVQRAVAMEKRTRRFEYRVKRNSGTIERRWVAYSVA